MTDDAKWLMLAIVILQILVEKNLTPDDTDWESYFNFPIDWDYMGRPGVNTQRSVNTRRIFKASDLTMHIWDSENPGWQKIEAIGAEMGAFNPDTQTWEI